MWQVWLKLNKTNDAMIQWNDVKLSLADEILNFSIYKREFENKTVEMVSTVSWAELSLGMSWNGTLEEIGQSPE